MNEDAAPGGATPVGLRDYTITTDWIDLADVPNAQSTWAHPGLAVSASGEIFGFHAGQLVAFDLNGHLLRVMAPGLTEGHGITLIVEDGTEFLWVSDPGFAFACTPDEGDEGLAPFLGKGLRSESGPPRVVKMTLDGEIVAELATPPVDADVQAGPLGAYNPCGTAVDEERFGGNGDVWVADGYGSSLVHHFDKGGQHLATLSGDESGRRFNCPHAVYIDRRGNKVPELYVADRGNEQVQVFGLNGEFRRCFGSEYLISPSGFVQWGENLVVVELRARLAALDDKDNLIGYIGATPDAHERPGWPNTLTEDGRAEAPHIRETDLLNSPHSAAVDAKGNLYVSEWLIGGRYSKIEPVRNSDVS